MNNCDICDYKITIINKVVKCPYCSFESCEKCCNKYLLLNSQPQCMNCKKVWNDDFVYSELSPKFLNKEYRTHMKDVIYDQEKSMLPETMGVLNNMKKVEKLRAKILKLREKITKYEEQIDELSNNENKKEIKKVNIIKECPNEDCKGFLNNKLICGLCDTQLCSKCEKVKDEEEDEDHICDEDDVKTVKMKKSECKNCPNCSKITYKDGGCDQVWCPPPCNNGIGTAWRFSTGIIDNDRPHAPLYYEYQRKMNNGILPRVDECRNINELPHIWNIEYKLLARGISNYNKDRIFIIHRNLQHNKYVLLNKYANTKDNFQRNLDLRLKYLKDEIDENRFKKTLILRHKGDKKKQGIYDNMHMVINVATDIFNKLMNTQGVNNDTIKDTLKELDNIRTYYNENIRLTMNRYNCKSLSVSTLYSDFSFLSDNNTT